MRHLVPSARVAPRRRPFFIWPVDSLPPHKCGSVCVAPLYVITVPRHGGCAKLAPVPVALAPTQKMIPNHQTVAEFLRRLGHRVALVARKPVHPHSPKSVVIWPVDQGEDPADIACGLASDYHAVYANLNPLHQYMAHVSPDPWRSVCDSMIARRTRILIDVDAHDCPKAEARDQFNAIRRELGEPLIAADSGNGYGLIYSCNLPANETSWHRVRIFLSRLREKYPCVDAGVFTASRLTRVIGTLNRSVTDGSRIETLLLSDE